MIKRQVFGTQSIRRAALLIKAIAAQNHEGVRLVDLAQKLPLDRTTIHRILKSLAQEQFVAQDPRSRRYFLGQTLFELGLVSSSRFRFRDVCGPILAQIAEKTGDTVFFNLRSGNDAVCIDRRQGPFPVKVLTLDIGDRRPLGTSASGLAILAGLPDEEVKEILSENESALIQYRKKQPKGSTTLAAVRRIRERGFASYAGELSDVRAVAVAIKNPRGRPIAAVSVTAISSRMGDERCPKVADIIKVHARELEQLVGESDIASWGL